MSTLYAKLNLCVKMGGYTASHQRNQFKYTFCSGRISKLMMGNIGKKTCR